jgi:integrase
LVALGRERVLIYRTLIGTGLRLNELRTLTVARLDLTPGAECVALENANEKNRTGSTLPLRADLAADLRQWITEKKLTAAALLFTVPAGLRRILDRDMKAAGIPKRDDRGRTVDVHALGRTTFATMLSTTGTAPRTAQAAMRHPDIKLTMGTYTDPKLREVRQAVERVPAFNPQKAETTAADFVHDFVKTGGPQWQFLASPDTMGTITKRALNSETLEMSTKNPR